MMKLSPYTSATHAKKYTYMTSIRRSRIGGKAQAKIIIIHIIHMIVQYIVQTSDNHL
jgi:hypothetical protein